MEQINVEQALNTAQTTGVENGTGVAENKVSYGKFKDADALLKAYNSLEAEFTKRSQRLKELESAVDLTDKQKITPTENTVISENQAPINNPNNGVDEKDIIEKYIKNLISSKPKAVVIKGGETAVTPIKKPLTIADAGKLAKQILI